MAGLAVALAAGGALIWAPAPAEPAPPPTVGQAWPGVQKGTLPARLADGTTYDPALVLDLQTSVGAAPTADRKHRQLVIRGPGEAVRELRRLPVAGNPSFLSPTVSGTDLVWVESTQAGQQLWAADLRTRRPARLLTADVGDARFYQTQYDLVVSPGRVNWVAAAPGAGTQIRSVALTGGPVETRTEPGNWALTAWPWMVDGLADISGAGRLRNLVTGEERAMPRTRLSETACTPVWCRVVSLDDDGYPKIEVVRTDGTDRRLVARETARTVITDVAVLGRFEIFAKVTAASELSGRDELLVYDITTNRVIQVSREAAEVWYRNGVLGWSTGNAQSSLRHVLDLRSV